MGTDSGLIAKQLGYHAHRLGVLRATLRKPVSFCPLKKEECHVHLTPIRTDMGNGHPTAAVNDPFLSTLLFEDRCVWRPHAVDEYEDLG